MISDNGLDKWMELQKAALAVGAKMEKTNGGWWFRDTATGAYSTDLNMKLAEQRQVRLSDADVANGRADGIYG